MIVWTPGFFAGDEVLASPDRHKSHTVAIMGNVVLTTPRKWTEYGLRPFVSGGLGVLGVLPHRVKTVFPDTGNIPAFNIGGGAIGFLSKRTGRPVRSSLLQQPAAVRRRLPDFAFGRLPSAIHDGLGRRRHSALIDH